MCQLSLLGITMIQCNWNCPCAIVHTWIKQNNQQWTKPWKCVFNLHIDIYHIIVLSMSYLTLSAQKMHDSAIHACPIRSRKLLRKMSRCHSTCKQTHTLPSVADFTVTTHLPRKWKSMRIIHRTYGNKSGMICF